MTTQTFCISSTNTTHSHLTGTYVLEHESDIGIKYTSIDGSVKITYSDKISNFIGGRWRWSKNSSPYTLYYGNASAIDSMPVSDWVSIDQESFSGTVHIGTSCSNINVTPTPTPSVTPTPTPSLAIPQPTPTPTLTVEEIEVIRNDLTEITQVRAKPTITYTSKDKIPTNTNYNILLTGYSLHYTEAVYLSANNSALGIQLIDLYNDTEFPAFSGTPVAFKIESENELIVTVPPVAVECDIDIIVTNLAGYGKLSPEYVYPDWNDTNLQHTLIHVVSAL